MVWAVLGLQNIDFHMAGDVEAHSHAAVRAARGRSSGHWRLPCPRGCQPMGWPRAILRRITLISFSHCLVLRIWSVMLSSPSLVYMSHPHRDLLFMLRPPPLQTVMLKFPFRVAHPCLLWLSVTEMMGFLFNVLGCLDPPPLPAPLSPLSLPRRLVAADDSPLG
jgi:hypothetical protein